MSEKSRFKIYNFVNLLEKAHLTTLLWLTSVSLELSEDEDHTSDIQGLEASQLYRKESYSSYSLKKSMYVSPHLDNFTTRLPLLACKIRFKQGQNVLSLRDMLILSFALQCNDLKL